jgi:hypothetical protein
MPSFEEILKNAKHFADLFSANKLDEIEAQMLGGVFTTSEEIFHAFSKFSFLKLAASEELIRLVSKYYPDTADLLFIFMEIYYDAVCSLTVGSSPGNTDIESGNLVLALKTLMPDEASRNAMIVTLAEKIHSNMPIPHLFSEMVRSLVEKVKTAYARQA